MDIKISVGLIHSRYTASDRLKHETVWTGLYGKDSHDRGKHGRILVGTQVLEQSIDVDADFLVTRFCPTDMLFQRMGRLWRHKRTRPEGARREAWILAPSLENALSAPGKNFGVTGLIYAPYILGRSLEVWDGNASVTIPRDIRTFLEKTYEERPEEPTPAMARARHELREKIEKMQAMALSSQAEGGDLPDSAATRLIDRVDCQLLLVRLFDSNRCELANGQKISFPCNDLPPGTFRKKKMDISAKLFDNMVKIREENTRAPQFINNVSSWRSLLEHYLPVQKNYTPIFLARILPDNTLEDLCTPGVKLGRYSKEKGWEAE